LLILNFKKLCLTKYGGGEKITFLLVFINRLVFTSKTGWLFMILGNTVFGVVGFIIINDCFLLTEGIVT
jgi:hypothetical protein